MKRRLAISLGLIILWTGACIHYRATGKTNFLAIAKKNADFLCRQWKAEPVRMARFPWNPSAFMGVAEMYRTTRDKRYLELLDTMIKNRGSRPNPDRNHAYGGTDQTQDRVPLHQEHLAVGHAVTGIYYYCGAADLYAETGDLEILAALERIWQDIHECKTDITLGVAMSRHSESRSPRGDEVHENFANGPIFSPICTVNPAPSNCDLPNHGTIPLELIPYYAWANRGLAYMDVWIPLAQ